MMPIIKKMFEKYLMVSYRTLGKCKNQLFIMYVPELYYKRTYRKLFGKRINLKHPANISEKLTWLTLNTYKNNPLVTMCVDKIEMQNYVKECGLAEYLNPILYTWNCVEEINWDELANQFVIKCNHGCGYNIICSDKSTLDVEVSKKMLSRWMREDFWKKFGEFVYKGIPHKILCEAYLDTGMFLPIDFKIHCFNGEPRIILVCSERENNLALSFFDLDWKYLDICNTKTNRTTQKPRYLEKMLNICRTLAKPFPFVRIDFYEYNEKPLIGELTFSPAGNMMTYLTSEGERILGNLLDLTKIQ